MNKQKIFKTLFLCTILSLFFSFSKLEPKILKAETALPASASELPIPKPIIPGNAVPASASEIKKPQKTETSISAPKFEDVEDSSADPVNKTKEEVTMPDPKEPFELITSSLEKKTVSDAKSKIKDVFDLSEHLIVPGEDPSDQEILNFVNSKMPEIDGIEYTIKIRGRIDKWRMSKVYDMDGNFLYEEKDPTQAILLVNLIDPVSQEKEEVKIYVKTNMSDKYFDGYSMDVNYRDTLDNYGITYEHWKYLKKWTDAIDEKYGEYFSFSTTFNEIKNKEEIAAYYENEIPESKDFTAEVKVLYDNTREYISSYLDPNTGKPVTETYEGAYKVFLIVTNSEGMSYVHPALVLVGLISEEKQSNKPSSPRSGGKNSSGYTHLYSSVYGGTWIKDGGLWKLRSRSGAYAKSQWAFVNEKWYLLGTDGYMLTGWKEINGTKYYLNPDGDVAIGWKFVDEKWYYFREDGGLMTNSVTPDGYYVNGSGEWIN